MFMHNVFIIQYFSLIWLKKLNLFGAMKEGDKPFDQKQIVDNICIIK